MANYYTQFSCVLDAGSPEKAQAALDIYRHDEPDEDGRVFADGFDLSINDDPSKSGLWIHSDEGDVEAVIQFVLICAERLDLQGVWGFRYADTCSRPLLDGFDGGAHVIDLSARKSIAWINTDQWLAAELDKHGAALDKDQRANDGASPAL